MKNAQFVQKMLILSAFCLFFANFATAQVQNVVSENVDFYRVSDDEGVYKSNLSVSAGFNFYQLANRIDNVINQNDTLKFVDIKSYGRPTAQIAYDFQLNSWFSLGAAYSRNRVGFEFKGLDYTIPSTGSFIKGDVDALFTRHTVTLRALGHYVNNEKFDMYSGVRFGATIWAVKFRGTASVKAEEQFQREFSGVFGRGAQIFPNAGVTLFGFRYFPIPNVGIGAEINVGQPYPLAASVNFRF
jgi:hypothetical protein